MGDMMIFPASVEEFMEQYKMTDTEHVYSNGTEYVPIYRMKQWFEHCRNQQRPTIDAVPVVRKPVVGYEGYYEVDQFGRVFSVERVISVDDNGRKYEKPVSGKQMKQCLKNNGYKSVSLTKGGSTKAFYVHRLVAEAFIPNPDNLPMVNHKDEDKTNNFLENLEWCTAKYNCNYGTGVKRHADKIRGRESEKRIAVIQRSVDGEFINRYSSVKDAATSVNGTTGAISAVCNGRRKTAYGYIWEHDFCSYGERKEGADNG